MLAGGKHTYTKVAKIFDSGRRERKNRNINGFLSPSHGYAVPAPSSEGAFGCGA